MKKNANFYDSFVREGRAVMFTDSQIDFLWDWFYRMSVNPETFTHKDNYQLHV